MSRSPFFASAVPDTRCSICGNSVCLETSNTDERGSAVHEECYVARTVTLFARQQAQLLARVFVPAHVQQ
jgi:hypothetical protein